MGKTMMRPFIYSAGGILLAAALIRFVIATGSTPVLAMPDPMLGISIRFALLIVGGIELIFALICLFGENVKLQTGLLAWLSTCFALFWLGLLWMHCHLQGTCLGSLTDPLHLSRGVIGFIMQLLPLGLLIGSYAALFHLWFASGGGTQSRTVQMAAKPNTDRTAPAILVQFLKISCSSCDGHIEFPVHALGQKISCPHCANTITLLSPS